MRMTDDRATHSFPDYAQEERCRTLLFGRGKERCGQPAAHKIEETSGPSSFHPMTTYICCGHFTQVLGPCANYPYDMRDEDEPYPGWPGAARY